MMRASPSVDSHQHVCWHGRDAAGLVADLDQHGIDHAWLLTWLIGPEEERTAYHGVLNPAMHGPEDRNPGVTLAEVLAATRTYPGRFVPGYCPNPSWRRAPDLLAAAHRMHGVRICGEWKFRLLIDDPRCLEIFRIAGALKMPVVLHLDVPYLADSAGGWKYDPEWYGGTIDNLQRALLACPQTIFVGHAPGFWREISGDATLSPEKYSDAPIAPDGRLEELFASHPNLMADLSASSGLRALRRDPEHARDFIMRHGARLLFGRDTYGGDLWAFLCSLDLPAAVLAQVGGGNAEKLVAAPTLAGAVANPE